MFLIFGFSLLILAIFRGLSTEIMVVRFGGPGRSVISIDLPPIWPPRNVRMLIQSNEKVDLIILNDQRHEKPLNYSNLTLVKAFRNLKNEVVDFEIPQRGTYYIVVRNNENTIVDGQIILTLYGLERDLTFLSVASICLGILFLIVWYFGLYSKAASWFPRR